MCLEIRKGLCGGWIPVKFGFTPTSSVDSVVLIPQVINGCMGSLAASVAEQGGTGKFRTGRRALSRLSMRIVRLMYER